MINDNNLWMESEIDIMELTMICVMINIPHASYKEWSFMWAQIETI